MALIAVISASAGIRLSERAKAVAISEQEAEAKAARSARRASRRGSYRWRQRTTAPAPQPPAVAK
jgi:hypothetical protein